MLFAGHIMVAYFFNSQLAKRYSSRYMGVTLLVGREGRIFDVTTDAIKARLERKVINWFKAVGVKESIEVVR